MPWKWKGKGFQGGQLADTTAAKLVTRGQEVGYAIRFEDLAKQM